MSMCYECSLLPDTENAKVNLKGLTAQWVSQIVTKQGLQLWTEVPAKCYLIICAQFGGVRKGFSEKVKARLEAETF